MHNVNTLNAPHLKKGQCTNPLYRSCAQPDTWPVRQTSLLHNATSSGQPMLAQAMQNAPQPTMLDLLLLHRLKMRPSSRAEGSSLVLGNVRIKRSNGTRASLGSVLLDRSDVVQQRSLIVHVNDRSKLSNQLGLATNVAGNRSSLFNVGVENLVRVIANTSSDQPSRCSKSATPAATLSWVALFEPKLNTPTAKPLSLSPFKV